MQTTINTNDLGRLAKLSCAVVHGMDFPEVCDNQQARKELLGEVERLDQHYRNDGLLFDIRAAVCSRPLQKQAIYRLTRSILRQRKGGQDCAMEQVSLIPPTITRFSVTHSEPASHTLYS